MAQTNCFGMEIGDIGLNGWQLDGIAIDAIVCAVTHRETRNTQTYGRKRGAKTKTDTVVRNPIGSME